MLVSKFDPGKYPWANPANWLQFTVASQAEIDPVLAGRLAAFAKYKNRKIRVTRGHVSTEEQEAICLSLLKQYPNYYRKENGGVYQLLNGVEKCMAAAPGTSLHESGLAIDDPDGWFKDAPNSELAPFGLFKPMAYEPWHVQLVETRGMLGHKAILYAPVSFPIKTKAFQAANGLIADDINGPATMKLAKKIYRV